MHWIERGPEPAKLKPIRKDYTQPWIDFYLLHTLGEKPTDARWREFRVELTEEFHSLCAYCEEFTRGEVDHFRPKRLYPALVYEWLNWLFACRACNGAKLEKLPTQGYLDPCDEAQRPLGDRYFDFDFLTGHVIPSQSLPENEIGKAQSLIDDLGLNVLHHLKRRRSWIEALEIFLGETGGPPSPELEKIRLLRTNRTTELSSLTRAWFSAHNYPQGEE